MPLLDSRWSRTVPLLPVRLVFGEYVLPFLSYSSMLSNSSMNSSHSFSQSVMVKSFVCSGAGLTSMRMTEFLIFLNLSSVSRMESHIPVASRPGGSKLSLT